MQILFFIFIAILLFVIYILASKEERKIRSKYEPRGKLEEYCASGHDRRQCRRFDTELDIKYRLLKSAASHSATSSKNISKLGVSILVYEILPKGSPVEIEMAVPNSKEPISIKGKIAWCEEAERLNKDGKRAFLAGVEFLDTKDDNQAKLFDYINTHLSKSEEKRQG